MLQAIKSHNFSQLRADFPILQQTNHGKPMVYLDSAATAQKPKVVIDAISQFYLNNYANIHRGIYELSAKATELYEQTRVLVKQFINATADSDVVFVRGTTEGINLIAECLRNSNHPQLQLRAGDEVILSEHEHHANIVPWYLLTQTIGIKIKVIPIQDDGALDQIIYQNLFSARTKLVAISHVSNALGTINPIKEMITLAHDRGVPVLVDGAQAVPHMPVDLKELDADFYVFSAHKLYGPTGIGVLCAKSKWLACLPPYQGGGDMIETVAFDQVTFAQSPQKFEAGTPHIAGAIGLSAAIQYLSAVDMSIVFEHEQQLLAETEKKLLTIPGLRIIGTAKPKVGVISMFLDDIHPHDLATVLDHEGIAVRAGHHCAMPLLTRLGLPATLRASFGLYTNEQDIDALYSGLQLATRLLR